MHAARRDDLAVERKLYIAQWEQHFKENVAGGWIWFDGIGS